MKKHSTLRIKIAVVLVFALLLQPGIRVSGSSSTVSENINQVSINSANKTSEPKVSVKVDPNPRIAVSTTPENTEAQAPSSSEDKDEGFSFKRLFSAKKVQSSPVNAPAATVESTPAWLKNFEYSLTTTYSGSESQNNIVLNIYTIKNSVENISIPAETVISGTTYTPMIKTTPKGLFKNAHNLKSIDLSNVDTSQMTDMKELFYNCDNLTSLSVSSIDTSSATSMSNMFGSCSKLTDLDVTNFDTSSVTDMSHMFSDCSSLTSLSVNNFVTSHVKDMNRMFSGCSSLEELDLSMFDAGSVTNAKNMFDGCENLKMIKLPLNLNTQLNLPGDWVYESGEGITENTITKTTESITVIRVDAYVPDPGKVQVISLSKNSLTLEEDASEILGYTITPDTAINKNVIWSSNDSSVATVSNGKVTGVAAGDKKAIITATTEDGNHKAYCTVTVVKKTIHVDTVSINNTSYTINIGDDPLDISGDVKVSPAEATNKKVTYKSLSPSVVFVSPEGLLRGLSEDDAIIEITSEDNPQASTVCNVTVKSVDVTGIVMSYEYKELFSNGTIGKPFTLTASVKPDNASNKKIIWSSSDETIAKVTSDGTVTPCGIGTAWITAKSSDNPNVQKSCEIKVTELTDPVTGIVLDTKSPISKKVGDKFTIGYSLTPSNPTNPKISWTSSDPNVAKVKNGVVECLTPGTALIEASSTDGTNIKAVCTVKVESLPNEVTSITLNYDSLDMVVGEEKTLSATVSPSSASDKTIHWKTNNASVATISNTGDVTAVGVGNAIITALALNGVSTVCSVEVTSTPVPVKDMYISPLIKTLYVGEAFNITATIIPKIADEPGVQWTSDKTDIATVDDTGRVLGKSKGEAIITATTVQGGKTAQCKVTVIDKITPSSAPSPSPSSSPSQTNYKLHITDQRNNNAPNKDKVRGTVETLAGDRYLVITDSDGNILKPRVNGDSSLTHHRAVYMDIRITDSSGNDKADFGKCTIRIPLIPEMDLNNGTVRVVAVNGDGIDKSISSSTGTEDGYSYVTFTSNHFCQYAILYKLNQSVIDYYNNPYTSLANLYQAANAANGNRARVLDYIPRTGHR